MYCTADDIRVVLSPDFAVDKYSHVLINFNGAANRFPTSDVVVDSHFSVIFGGHKTIRALLLFRKYLWNF